MTDFQNSHSITLPATTFRLGVVGKRIDGYLNQSISIPKNGDGLELDRDKVKDKLNEVFECVRRAVSEASSDIIRHLTDEVVENKPRLRIISSLTPGVDQMAGEWVVSQKNQNQTNVDTSLELILPAYWGTYGRSIWESSKKEAEKRNQTNHLVEADLGPLQTIFESANGILELDGRIAYSEEAATQVDLDPADPQLWSAKRLHAYRANAWFVSEQADILVAVFDPHAPAALAGTAEAVRLAVIKGLPVVAINLYNTEDVGILTNHVEFLQWGTSTPNPPPWKERLNKLVQYLLLPWPPDADAEAADKISNTLERTLKSAAEARSLSLRTGRCLDSFLLRLDWFASRFAPPPGGVRNPKTKNTQPAFSQEDIKIDAHRKNFRDLANAYRGGFRFSYLL